KTAVLILVALLIPVVPFLIIGELPGERWLSSADENALTFGLSGAGLLASDVLLPIPSSIIGTMLGARLGLLPGWLWGFLGMTTGNLIGYAAGRLLLARFGTRLPRAPTLVAVFLTRPVPVLAEAMAFTAGAERVRVLPFLMVCAAGNAIYALVLALDGAALLHEDITGPGLVLPMVLPVVAWLLWRWLRARQSPGTVHKG
ncbi:MAG: VTT domain-containing protein, partial [Chromatiaceae bacterium]|nr:VTT domain-containing protein [Chromatiaceae bacterium]